MDDEALYDPLRICISSTRADLAQYREATAAVIAKLQKEYEEKRRIVKVSMESELQNGQLLSAAAVSVGWIKKSHWVVLIVAWHYGSVALEGELNGMSVTEVEYHYAKDQNKKIFKFMPGDPGTRDAYRQSDHEQQDLRDWYFKQDAQRERIDAFRKTLSDSYTTFFRNIDDYQEKLEATLRKNIASLPPPVPPQSRLAELILKAEPAFKRCISSIESLTRCKEIHDALHTIRHDVIKPVREVILPKWESTGVLSNFMEGKLNKLNTKVHVLCERIKNKMQEGKRRQQLPGPLLQSTVDRVHEQLPLWERPEREGEGEGENDPNDSGDLLNFSERLDNLALAVEKAFRSADISMQDENSEFLHLHADLQRKVSILREKHGLSDNESKILDEELATVKRNADRLEATLKTHNKWQEIHDELTGTQSYAGLPQYANRVRMFQKTYQTPLAQILDDTLRYTQDYPDEWATTQDKLLLLQDSLNAWTAQGDATQFASVTAAFDEAFYKVDKSTLLVVELSATRVDGFEKLLRSLHKGLGNDDIDA